MKGMAGIVCYGTGFAECGLVIELCEIGGGEANYLSSNASFLINRLNNRITIV